MTRHHIDYGIDLGTTNSAIARVEQGQVRVFQHAPANKMILPSCVSCRLGQIEVGDRPYSLLSLRPQDVVSGFKRNMGTAVKYTFKTDQTVMSPEELSAEVLKQLKQAVPDDDDIVAAVITVPAAFGQVQIEATRRAAELAGLKYAEFLPEPIAASLAFFKDQKEIEGTWLVFDFGGGTFDAAIVRLEDGIMRVVDNEGDPYLGGRDFDRILAEHYFLPAMNSKHDHHRLMTDPEFIKHSMEILPYLAEDLKKALSSKLQFTYEPDVPLRIGSYDASFDFRVTLTRRELEQLVISHIKRATDLCNLLLTRNRIAASDLETVLMIGGPTLMPIVRERVKSDLAENINVSIDPMTAVAQGAALFASTRKCPVAHSGHEGAVTHLTLVYPDTTVEETVAVAVRVSATSRSDSLDGATVQLGRHDGGEMTGRIKLQSGACVVKVRLLTNVVNTFAVELMDRNGNRVACEPDCISILQGLKLAQPPLPDDYGISAVVLDNKLQEELVPILQKGTSLPAVGKKKFTVPKALRPGKAEDALRIVVWEGRGGSRPTRNVLMKEVVVTGEQLTSYLPEGSEVEITIRVDESRITRISAYFPYLDDTIEVAANPDVTWPVIPLTELRTEIAEECDRLHELIERSKENDVFDVDNLYELESELQGLAGVSESPGLSDDVIRQTHRRLNEVGRQVDNIEKSARWPVARAALLTQRDRTVYFAEKYGDDKLRSAAKQLFAQADRILQGENFQRAKELTERLSALEFQICAEQPGFWISVLKAIADDFAAIKWLDQRKARTTVDKGIELLNSRGWNDEIKQTVYELWTLMPDDESGKRQIPRTDIPHYTR